MPDDNNLDDIVLARQMRAEAERARQDIAAHGETVKPLLQRLKDRRIENSFGEEYELTPVRSARRAS